MPAQQPVVLKKDSSWSPESVLVVECTNHADYMTNVRVHFNGKDNSVRLYFGTFPHWPCRVPLPLKVAEGGTLFLSRTPGRFKSTVSGANLGFNELEEIVVSVPEGAEETMDITRAAVEPSMPDEYLMPPEPLVDSLHQWRAREWPGKASSLESLKGELENDLSGAEPDYPEGWSKYGGCTEKKFRATGFFRTENENGTWWLVDPEGNAFWSMGVCCVRVGSGVNTTDIESAFEETLPSPVDAPHLWTERNGQKIFAGMAHNLERALGPDWKEKWNALTAKRLKEKYVNTIANWSDPELFGTAKVPYVYHMHGFPSTERTIFRDFPDVFADGFERYCTSFVQQLEKFRDDPFLIGYFMTNEPQWAFVQGFDIGKQLLMAGEPFTSLDVFIGDLKAKYETIEKLNSAWSSSFKSFNDLEQPLDPRQFPGCGDDTMAFTEKAVEHFVRVPAMACKAVDPNHMNLGLRWAYVHSDYQLAGADLLDAFSINCYQLKPVEELVNRIIDKTGKPVMIGEFHVGCLDRGLPAGGIRNTRTMKESAEAYQYYVENGAVLPGLVGTHYFQWNDQHVMGRFDGENMQIGMHDITYRPYPEWTEICRKVHQRVYNIRTGKDKPSGREPDVVPNGTLVW